MKCWSSCLMKKSCWGVGWWMKTHDARHTPGPRLLWQRFTTSGDEEEDEVANNEDTDDHHDGIDNEDGIAMKTTAATTGPQLFLHQLPIMAKHHINTEADDKVSSCLHLLDRLIKKTASPSSFSAGPAHPMIQQSHYPLSLPHPSIVCTRSWYVSIIMATKIDCCWLLLGLGSVHAYSPVGSSHHYEGAAGRSGWERLTR